MGIKIKTKDEIEKMRVAGQLAAQVLEMIGPEVREGVSTETLDRICHDYMVQELGCIPAPLNYKGFPKSICTSVNQQVCHGIPNHKKLKNGDIINIDITVIKNGYHGDTSRMFYVGAPSLRAKRLVEITYECLRLGIEQVKPGGHLGDVGQAIQRHAEKNGFSVVREYCGHGIGRDFHEEPQVLHYRQKESGVPLVPGMTFTIEPMINAGKRQVKKMSDGWTVQTKDRQLSAQWEHTVLVTQDSVEVLTPRSDEQF